MTQPGSGVTFCGVGTSDKHTILDAVIRLGLPLLSAHVRPEAVSTLAARWRVSWRFRF